MAKAFVATIATFVVFIAQMFFPATFDGARALFLVAVLAASAGLLFQLLRPADEAPVAVIDALTSFALLSQFPMIVDYAPQSLTLVFWLVLAPLGVVLMRLSPAFSLLNDMSPALGWVALLVGATLGVMGGAGFELSLKQEGLNWLVPFETIPRVDFLEMRIWPESSLFPRPDAGRVHANHGIVQLMQVGFSLLAAIRNLVIMSVGIWILLLGANVLVVLPLLGVAGVGGIIDRWRSRKHRRNG